MATNCQSHRGLLLHLAWLLGAPLAGVASCQEGPDDQRSLINQSVDWYQLRMSTDEPALQPLIVLRWPNPVRGADDGASVVWLADGRPEAIASIYIWNDHIHHEYDSLSRGTVVADRQGTIVWQPERAGLKFHPIPGARPPARSPTRRLRQLKELARQFSSTLLGWNDDDSQRERLRLIPTPLYRYEIAEPKDVIDGALFAFALGTDPESLLVIEAVRHAGTIRWEYAFVRQYSGGLESRLGDTVVWTVGARRAINDPRSTHIVFSRRLNEVSP